MPNIHSSISFALVNIPIVMNPIIRNNDTSFNQLHNKCLNRINYIKYCPHCKKNLKEKDIVKGYSVAKDDYLVFTKEELNSLKPISEKEIEIISFVKEAEIPVWFYEKSYFLEAEGKSKAYKLFAEGLKKSKMVAIAKTVIGTKFYYGVLKIIDEGIIFTTLYFDEEVKIPDNDIELKTTSKELDLAIKLIESMKAHFEPEKYKDEYQDRIKKAIDNKLKGKKVSSKKVTSSKKINDLMKALEKSLENAK